MPTTIKVLKFSYVHFSTPRMSNCGWLRAFGNICRLSGRKETERARSIYCKDYADQNYNQYIIIIIYTIIIIYCKDYAELFYSLHTGSVKPSYQMPLCRRNLIFHSDTWLLLALFAQLLSSVKNWESIVDDW